MKLTIIMPFGVKTESKLLLPLIVIEILVGMSSIQSQVLFAFTQDDKNSFGIVRMDEVNHRQFSPGSQLEGYNVLVAGG